MARIGRRPMRAIKYKTLEGTFGSKSDPEKTAVCIFTYRRLQFQNLTLKNCLLADIFFYFLSLFNMARGVTEKSFI